MGSRTVFVSMNSRSSPFSYTDSGPGKPALKDWQHVSSGKEDNRPDTGEHQLKQLPPENTKGSKKTGIRSIFRGKKDKHKSTPPAPPRKSNDYTPYESTVLNKATSPAVKAPSERGRKTKANVKKKIDSGSTLRFAGEEGLHSSKEHIYESPADAQESSDHVYQCNRSSYEETQWRASSHHTPAGTHGRPSYAAIPLPTKSALRTTASLPNCYSPRFTKKLPARQASFGHKIHSRLESPQGDEMGGADYCDDDDVGEMYSQIAENIEHDDVLSSNDMYEDVLIAANTKIPIADPNDDDDDDLCTDSCDVGKLSLQSSCDDERVNCLNALPVKPRPKIEKKNSSRVIVIQQDCTSDDQDARYVPTGTISTPQPGPNNSKPKPKPKPPKPTPRARSSLMSQGPKQPSNDIINIPPQPAKKPPKELPEIQLLVDEAWKLINTSEKNNSTKLIVTSVDFTAGLIDEEGGRLQLRYHGVTLDVPPGALEDVEMVYIYVQRSLEFSPIGEEGFASPLVHCGLSGLKFKTPVVLTFPVHLEDPSAWELKGIQQDSSGTPWKEISSESCPDSLVVFKDRLCTMVVDHFTLFGVSAPGPQELRGASGGSDESHGWLRLRVGVFLPRDKTTMSGHLQLRVRIWDESQETRVNDEERHSKVIDTTCTFLLRTSEGSGSQQSDLDVSVAIRGLNDSWRSDPKEKIIPYQNFHLDPRRVDESVTFNLTLQSRDSEGGLHPLLCDFFIGQRAHFNLAKIVRAVVDIHDGALRIETAHDSPNPMSTSGFHLLRDYLERERRWKLLADSSFGKTQGCTFDRWSCPSTAVLNAIFSRSVAQNPKATLGELYSKLGECGLPGAAEIVSWEMKEWNLGGTGSETTQARGSQSRKSPEPKFPVQCSGEDSSLPRPICNAQQESLYEVLMPKKERERIAQARPSPTRNRVSRRGPEENDEEKSRIHTLRSTNPPARAQPERICQARPSSTGNRASRRKPEENDEEPSQIHPLLSNNPPARAQPERICQARPSSTGNRGSRRKPEENDEEESQIHPLLSNNPPAQAQSERIVQARPSSTGNRASRRKPEENDEEPSQIHPLLSNNPPAQAQPERIVQAQPSSTGNRASRRKPEENDEEPSQIHPLHSTNPPAQAPPSFIPRTPRKQLATQKDHLLRLVPTHVDPKSNGAYEETTAFGRDVRQELTSNTHQPTAKNFPIPQSHQPPDFMINPNAEGDALAYAECLVTDQSGQLKEKKSSIYENAQVIPPSSSSSQLPKGYVQLKSKQQNQQKSQLPKGYVQLKSKQQNQQKSQLPKGYVQLKSKQQNQQK